MTDAKDRLQALPLDVRARLDELRRWLGDALGDDLAAMVVYGSAVRGGWRADRSNVNVLLVLRDASRKKLEAIGPLLHTARYAGRIEATVLAADEIPRSVDVFPLFYDDVRECHALLAGADPFAGLEIADVHRRLRIEQELRDARIRLRGLVIAAQGAEGPLVEAVAQVTRLVRAPLRALLRLRGAAADGALESVLAAAGETYAVPTRRVLAAREAPGAACDALAALLDAAIDDVDRRGDDAPASAPPPKPAAKPEAAAERSPRKPAAKKK